MRDIEPTVKPATPLVRLDTLADGSLTRCLHRGSPILLCRVGPDVYALDDACTHEDVSLSLGALSGHCLRCPLHGAAFDVRDGSVLAEPADRALRTWPVRVVDGWVTVEEGADTHAGLGVETGSGVADRRREPGYRP